MNSWHPIDLQSVLADYDRAILLDPNLAEGYMARVELKYTHPIDDLRAATNIYRNNGEAENLQNALDILDEIVKDCNLII
jgi:hypothetical protein